MTVCRHDEFMGYDNDSDFVIALDAEELEAVAEALRSKAEGLPLGQCERFGRLLADIRTEEETA